MSTNLELYRESPRFNSEIELLWDLINGHKIANAEAYKRSGVERNIGFQSKLEAGL